MKTVWSELLWWLLGKRQIVRVTGYSMTPTLQPKDLILVNPNAYLDTSPQVGNIVLARRPHHNNLIIVKRVRQVREDGACFLIGDNSFPLESTDSRSYGFVPSQLILGQVTSLFW